MTKAQDKAEQPKKLDYKKQFKDLYQPKTRPSLITVDPINYLMVEGSGDPNQEEGEYSQAMEILYGLSWTIKMSKMGARSIDGYFEYVVPPLDGLWWIDGFIFDGMPIQDKSKFQWISMIRQPEFVTEEVFEWAKEALSKKSPHLTFDKTRLAIYEEGLCAQVMHIGPYDLEVPTIEKLSAFIHDEGYTEDISSQHDAFPLARRHHEIYLSDPRKANPDTMKTIIRHPIRKA